MGMTTLRVSLCSVPSFLEDVCRNSKVNWTYQQSHDDDDDDGDGDVNK